MDHTQAIQAIRGVGEQLAQAGMRDRMTVILGGSVAAMASADFAGSRETYDCDVLVTEPNAIWHAIEEAAGKVAVEQGLPVSWLNRDARMYAYLLPLGWRERCVTLGRFGPLTALAISRIDLLAMKLIGATVRAQDLEDLVTMRPTRMEIAFLRAYLDRLEAESLHDEPYTAPHAILRELESNHEGD